MASGRFRPDWRLVPGSDELAMDGRGGDPWFGALMLAEC